jgi:DNA-binding LytR/AlgR family response regulator
MAMKLRCMIIDDEPLARKGLEEEVDAIDFLEIAGIAENALQANKLMASLQPDLIFLDIRMPKLNGLDFLRALKNPPMAIIITAYSEFALEGFTLDVIDYLVKPVAFDRLLKACNKAREFYAFTRSKTKEGNYHSDFFYIKCGNKFEKIFLHELLFIKAVDNYVSLHTTTRSLISYLTLKNVEAYLPEGNFMKVHKSYIVAIDKIVHIEGNEISVGGKNIPISRMLKDEVMERIVNNKLIKR